MRRNRSRTAARSRRSRASCSPIICWPSRSRASCCWRRSSARCFSASNAEKRMLAEALFFSAVLFVIGVFGVLIRRNAIIVFMCVELMLNAVNLSFVAFAQAYGVGGQVFVFFVMTVAAAEAAVGLAIIIALFRHRPTVNLQNINLLKG